MDTLRVRSRWLSWAIGGLLLMLLAVAAIVTAAFLSGRYANASLLVQQLPILFYAWALWSVRKSLAAFAAGGTLTEGAGRSMQAVGISLFLGGLSNVFAVPLILRAMRGTGSIAHFDVAAITLGAIGLALVVIGRLLADSEAMRRELDEFV